MQISYLPLQGVTHLPRFPRKETVEYDGTTSMGTAVKSRQRSGELHIRLQCCCPARLVSHSSSIPPHCASSVPPSHFKLSADAFHLLVRHVLSTINHIYLLLAARSIPLQLTLRSKWHTNAPSLFSEPLVSILPSCHQNLLFDYPS